MERLFPQRLLKDSRLGLLLALLFAASMWFYVQARAGAVPEGGRGGPRTSRAAICLTFIRAGWGARELLLHHRDPYSPEVTREIQTGYYGRPLDPGRCVPTIPRTSRGLPTPCIVVFLLAPTIGLPFPVVQNGFPLAAGHSDAGQCVLVAASGALASCHRRLIAILIDPDPGQLLRWCRESSCSN